MSLGVITQARMKSSRLPGKVLKEIDGKPLLYYHTERLKERDLPVIVATTKNTEAKPIVGFCEERNIDYFRGDEHDVLGRFYGAATAFGLDTIVRVTSDCPLIDPAFVEQGIDKYSRVADTYDYLSSSIPDNTYPLGFSFEVFSFELLAAAHRNAEHPKKREHVTPYMKRKEHPATTCHGYTLEQDFSDYRVTVDTPEDFELVRKLIEDFDADSLTLEEIVEILRQNPELRRLNSDVHQKTWRE
jgi:spore coat polysaccharide biosynthesis protein SpsF